MSTQSTVDSPLAVSVEEAAIDAIFRDLNQCQAPGAVVGVAVDGRPVYRKGFGLASVEQPLVLTPATRMSVGSVTKHFTALAFLRLCEKGRASLDAPIGTWLPDSHPTTRRVTARQLLGHVSGLRDATDFVYQLAEASCRVSSQDIIELYRDLADMNFAPGEGFNYNNGGYVLVGAIIERIAAQPLEEVFRTQLFEPAGLYDTVLRRADCDLIANCARGHLAAPGSGYRDPRRNVEAAGQGGVVSTVDDLLRWLRQFDSPEVAPAASWAVMQAPQTLANGFSTDYGLGLMVGRYRGVPVLAHAGNAAGATAHMVKVPSAGLDVVVMANRSDVTSRALACKVIDACVMGFEPPSAVSLAAGATGTFLSSKTGRVVELCVHEGRQMAVIDGFPIEFVASADGVMRPSELWSFFKFEIETIGDSSCPRALQLRDCGRADVLESLPPSEGGLPPSVQGTYECTVADMSATVSDCSAGPRMRVAGKFGAKSYPLRCLGANLWRAAETQLSYDGGVVCFDSGGDSLSMTTGRNFALRFRRTRNH